MLQYMSLKDGKVTIGKICEEKKKRKKEKENFTTKGKVELKSCKH